MDFAVLETLADDAINSSKNYVQIWNKDRLPYCFPIPNIYVGFYNGWHIYNLDALVLKQRLVRHRLEFEIN